MLTPSCLICHAGLIVYKQFPIVISSSGWESRSSILGLVLLRIQYKSSDLSKEKFKPIIAALSSCASVLALIRGAVSAGPCLICTKLISLIYDVCNKMLLSTGISSMAFAAIANRTGESILGFQKSDQSRKIIAYLLKILLPTE
jgi:hypothetical protein